MTYQIDPKHSAARFKVRHMMIANVGGEFNSVSGTIDFDPDKPEQSRVEATIDTNSLHTGDPQRDAHIKGADFSMSLSFPPSKSARTKGLGPATGNRGPENSPWLESPKPGRS